MRGTIITSFACCIFIEYRGYRLRVELDQYGKSAKTSTLCEMQLSGKDSAGSGYFAPRAIPAEVSLGGTCQEYTESHERLVKAL